MLNVELVLNEDTFVYEANVGEAEFRQGVDYSVNKIIPFGEISCRIKCLWIGYGKTNRSAWLEAKEAQQKDGW